MHGLLQGPLDALRGHEGEGHGAEGGAAWGGRLHRRAGEALVQVLGAAPLCLGGSPSTSPSPAVPAGAGAPRLRAGREEMAHGSRARATHGPRQGEREGNGVQLAGGGWLCPARPRLQLGLSPQTPERPRHAGVGETLRGRASSPRRAGPVGEGRFHLPPRIHRASDPGLPGEGGGAAGRGVVGQRASGRGGAGAAARCPADACPCVPFSVPEAGSHAPPGRPRHR